MCAAGVVSVVRVAKRRRGALPCRALPALRDGVTGGWLLSPRETDNAWRQRQNARVAGILSAARHCWTKPLRGEKRRRPIKSKM